MSAWEENAPGFRLKVAAAVIALGVPLLVWRPHFGLAWLIVAGGVGLAAQRWVSRQQVTIVTAVLLVLALRWAYESHPGENPLLWSAIGLWGSAWYVRLQERRERATE